MAREVQSSIVTKCVEVLDILAESSNPLSYSEIVEASGLSKSSAHRIISILLKEDLARYEEATRTYSVGPKLVGWARAAWQKTDLQLIRDQDLIELRDQTGLNVAVSVLTGNAVMFIRTFDRQSVRYAPKIGQQSQLHCTAAGKVFLAWSGPDLLRTYLQEEQLEKYTEYTLTEPSELQQDLELTRQRGLGVCRKEELLQVTGIAVPVLDYQGSAIAAVSLWAPAKLAASDQVIAKGPELMEFGKRLSAMFGQMS